MNHKKERRKSRRVAVTLDAVLTGPGAEPIEVETMNLSAGGVYVTTPRYLAPFTKVQLGVDLPPFGQGDTGEEIGGVASTDGDEDARAREDVDGDEGARASQGEDESRHRAEGEATGASSIQVEGIVVRCEPDEEAPERHAVAIAFLHLPPEMRNRIEAYVTWRLERSLIESAGGLGTGT